MRSYSTSIAQLQTCLLQSDSACSLRFAEPPSRLLQTSSKERRPGERDYQRFLYVALASARECGYLIDLATRLNYLDSCVAAELVSRFGKVQASLLQLCRAIEARGQRVPIATSRGSQHYPRALDVYAFSPRP